MCCMLIVIFQPQWSRSFARARLLPDAPVIGKKRARAPLFNPCFSVIAPITSMGALHTQGLPVLATI